MLISALDHRSLEPLDWLLKEFPGYQLRREVAESVLRCVFGIAFDEPSLEHSFVATGSSLSHAY